MSEEHTRFFRDFKRAATNIDPSLCFVTQLVQLFGRGSITRRRRRHIRDEVVDIGATKAVVERAPLG